ncbi:MAG: hypothetical protein OXN92_02370 [Gammaproteobacteria bacterium]|nr:hypothetical protein [Gammaproteobacteria bacterium]
MSKAKVMENRMRRTADRLGFSLSKSRVTGLWSLIDDDGRFFMNGDLREVSVQEVADQLEDALDMESKQKMAREEEEARFFLDDGPAKYPLLFGEDNDGDE